jgi:uncharacterized OsmC-like protein
MRNGLNITGVSELVHELRERPEEAVADFTVECPAGPAAEGTVTAATRTARIGTLRVARPFTLVHRLSRHPGAGAPCPSPHEGALAALASCALITQVNGVTARGVTIGSLQVTARAELALDASGCPVAGQPLEHLRWDCDLESDGPTDVVGSIVRLVAAFSPNHRAFTDACPFDLVTVNGKPLTSTHAPTAAPGVQAPAATTATVEATVVWEYGSEATYTTATTVHGVRHASLTAPTARTVDQTKQMLGIDKGPNSQEILLASVCAELFAELSGAGPDGAPAGPALRAGGRIDDRGMMNVLRTVPSRLHDLSLEVSTRGAAPAGTEDLVRAALSRSVLVATLAQPRTIEVELRHNGTLALNCVTDTAQAEALRDELTRRAAAAAQPAAADAT